MRQNDPEAFDTDYEDECATLQGQALELAEQEPDGVCSTCRGTGEVSDYEDVCGDGGSRMQVWGPCPDCIEAGLCPVCGSDNLSEDDYCTCKTCGFKIDLDADSVVNPKATADAAVAALREQAHWQDAQYPSPDALPVPTYAEVWTWNYDIEIVQGVGHAPDMPCWCWEVYRHNGWYPTDGCGGYASADEALSAALEVAA